MPSLARREERVAAQLTERQHSLLAQAQLDELPAPLLGHRLSGALQLVQQQELLTTGRGEWLVVAKRKGPEAQIVGQDPDTPEGDVVWVRVFFWREKGFLVDWG